MAKKKKSLRQHARELHAIGKKYIAHTLKTIELHSSKKKRAAAKKQLKIMANALKELAKIELR